MLRLLGIKTAGRWLLAAILAISLVANPAPALCRMAPVESWCAPPETAQPAASCCARKVNPQTAPTCEQCSKAALPNVPIVPRECCCNPLPKIPGALSIARVLSERPAAESVPLAIVAFVTPNPRWIADARGAEYRTPHPPLRVLFCSWLI